jgi:hypothetical protein
MAVPRVILFSRLVRHSHTVQADCRARCLGGIQLFLTGCDIHGRFSRSAKLAHRVGAPYSLLVMAAQLPRQFFSNSLSASSNSFIRNANLIVKVYFPRLIISSMDLQNTLPSDNLLAMPSSI